MNLKLILKKFNWINCINIRVKSYLVKKNYLDIVSYYRDKKIINFESLIRAKLPLEFKQKIENGKLRIFYLGTDEQQDKAGILQALQKIGSLSYFTRDDGSYGQNDPCLKSRRSSNSDRLLRLFIKASEDGNVPDILIAQTWSCLIDPEVFTKIRNLYGTFVVNIAMDDRHQYFGEKTNGMWTGTFPLIPHLDLVLTAAPEAVEWYLKEGCPALFFPEASDPNIFYPMPGIDKIYDVCFVGACYGIRRELVNALRSAGLNVAAFGSGWEGGRIETEEVPLLFAQSKIVLGVGTIGQSSDFCGLKMRDFDATMSGSCYLTQYNSDLNFVYNLDTDLVTYGDIQDCVKKALHLISNDEQRELIALNGRRAAFSRHTWLNRFETLISILYES